MPFSESLPFPCQTLPIRDPESTPHLALGAVLLAAGAASRMSFRPKCLLELQGEPLLIRLIKALQQAGVAHVVVVVGQYADRIKRVLRGLNVVLVHNPDLQPGPEGSLRLGLQALPPHLHAVLVALADQPLIQAQDIRELVGQYQNRPQACHWVRPQVDGTPGHPVIFSPQVRASLLDKNTTSGGAQWARTHPEQVHLWDSTNAHYVTDVDTMADVLALRSRSGLDLKWPADLVRTDDP